jgi:FtsH-binding integral membrane protein
VGQASTIMSTIPTSAFWLGWAGVIPFAGLAALLLLDAAPVAGLDQSRALSALLAYGMIILSFMGGVQWGLEMARGSQSAGAARGLGYAVSVVPALIAFGASFASPAAALLILAVGFALLLAYDLQRIREGVGPDWYARLRVQLSTAVVACLAAAVGTVLPGAA